MKRSFSIFALAAVMALQGCSGDSKEAGDQQEPASLADLRSKSDIEQEVKKKEAAKAPSADKSVPLDKYVELDSGKQLMFAFLAVDKMPVNYERVASILSSDYAREQDDFKKRDLLNALKPVIDAEIEKAKAGGYYYMSIDDALDKYNFDAKAFGHTGFDEGGYRYFYDNSTYRMKFSNAIKFQSVKVEDETLAREIESLRSKSSRNLKTFVYFYINATELGSEYALAEITKVVIKDKSGRELIAY